MTQDFIEHHGLTEGDIQTSEHHQKSATEPTHHHTEASALLVDTTGEIEKRRAIEAALQRQAGHKVTYTEGGDSELIIMPARVDEPLYAESVEELVAKQRQLSGNIKNLRQLQAATLGLGQALDNYTLHAGIAVEPDDSYIVAERQIDATHHLIIQARRIQGYTTAGVIRIEKRNLHTPDAQPQSWVQFRIDGIPNPKGMTEPFLSEVSSFGVHTVKTGFISSTTEKKTSAPLRNEKDSKDYATDAANILADLLKSKPVSSSHTVLTPSVLI